jgi:hypothetical protein
VSISHWLCRQTTVELLCLAAEARLRRQHRCSGRSVVCEVSRHVQGDQVDALRRNPADVVPFRALLRKHLLSEISSRRALDGIQGVQYFFVP